MRRLLLVTVLLGLAFTVSAPAEQPRASVEAPAREPAPAPEPKHIDDDEMYDNFFDKLEGLAKDKKCLSHNKLVAKLKPRPAGITPAKPSEKALSPEEVCKTAVPSIFIVGSVYPDKKTGEWEIGTYATAWVLASDGVLVTNWHVFEDLEKSEVFGAGDRDGNVYPVTDFLGGDKVADVAVFRIAAKDLTPLPVAPTHAEVGSWVGLISHPGDLFYIYTQGHVTRYSTGKNEDGKREKWMGITAEYASGSSGAPVLNKYGAVTGMACLTLSLDAVDDSANLNRRKKAIGIPLRRSRQDERQDGKP